MNLKNALLRGTLLLTFASILSRFIGCFYRIFLANTIGAEGMGIYQLIFPIYSICFSLCASGIETAISKLTAAKYATGRSEESSNVLKTGLFLTLMLSLSCSFIMFNYAEIISRTFLKDPRCAELLKILAFTIPFGTLQSCFCGYYFGIHKAAVPSAAQLIEQSFRMLAVFVIHKIFVTNQISISPAIAVLGLVIGEICAFLFTITCVSFQTKQKQNLPLPLFSKYLAEILRLSTPLTLSRISINLLASLEAVLIPNALRAYGMDLSNALSVYGILYGMALPFILFPNALTGSISLMLLPVVSGSQAGGNLNNLKRTLKKIFSFCLLLGCLFLIFFLIFGNFLGEFIFSNTQAGTFITVLAWICPFLYLNTTLNSVLNGLGHTEVTFFIGICSLFIRIGFVVFGIPKFGIHGYLFGLLASQLFVTFCGSFSLRRNFTGTKS